MSTGMLFKVLLFLLFALPLFGDQCSIMLRSHAEKALSLLHTDKNIMYYCAPCDDVIPKQDQVRKVKLVEEGASDFDTVTIRLEGKKLYKSIDLAYIYIEMESQKGVFENLAMLSGCPVESVPYAINSKGELSIEPSFEPTVKVVDEYFYFPNAQGVLELIKYIYTRDSFSTGSIIFKDGTKVELSESSLVGQSLSFQVSEGLFKCVFEGKYIKQNNSNYIFKGNFRRIEQSRNISDILSVELTPVYFD